jgi:hypothetical protein
MPPFLHSFLCCAKKIPLNWTCKIWRRLLFEVFDEFYNVEIKTHVVKVQVYQLYHYIFKFKHTILVYIYLVQTLQKILQITLKSLHIKITSHPTYYECMSVIPATYEFIL